MLGVPPIIPLLIPKWNILSKFGEIVYEVGVPPVFVGSIVEEIVTPLVKLNSFGE